MRADSAELVGAEPTLFPARVYFCAKLGPLALELAEERMFDHPRIFFLVSFFMLWISAQAGASLRRRRWAEEEECVRISAWCRPPL